MATKNDVIRFLQVLALGIEHLELEKKEKNRTGVKPDNPLSTAPEAPDTCIAQIVAPTEMAGATNQVPEVGALVQQTSASTQLNTEDVLSQEASASTHPLGASRKEADASTKNTDALSYTRKWEKLEHDFHIAEDTLSTAMYQMENIIGRIKAARADSDEICQLASASGIYGRFKTLQRVHCNIESTLASQEREAQAFAETARRIKEANERAALASAEALQFDKQR